MPHYQCSKCKKEYKKKPYYDKHIATCPPPPPVAVAATTPVATPPTPIRRVLSLFSGIGGMDMGFDGQMIVHKDSLFDHEFIEGDEGPKDFVKLKRQNFRVVFQNDILAGAKEVCQYNGAVTNYVVGSIYDLLIDEFIFPAADIVVGGFPCQDFSHCGRRRGFDTETSHNLTDTVDDGKDNNRGSLYKSFVEVVRRVGPKIFVAENVYGLLTMPGDPIKQIIHDFSELGYDVEYQLIDCTEHGIPQTRKRVIIMGMHSHNRKNGLEGCRKKLEKSWNIITKNKTRCCVGKYFKHLEEPSDTADISQQMYSKAKKLEKGQGQKEIDMNGPAPTMRAEHHGNIEFRRYQSSTLNFNEKDLPERRLTVREAGLIQTFPPDYIFTKTQSQKAYKYIGNAVPPLLGYLIADHVSNLLKMYF